MLSVSSGTMPLHRRNTFSIGLMIALSSWALIFLTLLWGYVVFRLRASMWLGNYMSLQVIGMALVNTLIIATSSWALSLAVKKNSTYSALWAWTACALGILFLVGQILLWQCLLQAGLHWRGSMAGSFFFLLTGFHALHILGGLVAVFVFCLNIEKWQGSLRVSGIKYFWDFLLVVWLLMFVLIFMIR